MRRRLTEQVAMTGMQPPRTRSFQSPPPPFGLASGELARGNSGRQSERGAAGAMPGPSGLIAHAEAPKQQQRAAARARRWRIVSIDQARWMRRSAAVILLSWPCFAIQRLLPWLKIMRRAVVV